ncbi:TetR/AcrR family transcriptional regulator [Caballeronia sp. LZ043]|uniref:TetR/AcrR family transcriptional regulator n=1 Tax=Caballeronia sp. LZ043 TaxID=3038569 RepID=UPI002865F899|nr:TetR/AcrR family transcriptional regulator [Caballeronia sp. LZ043]MDR5825197.1 TetR/AcrR family transcriptional regulator [Caballeronia sp. LZ043]
MTNGMQRSTYRHGDLRRALIDAGIELAREGGPDAIVLREATRRAGVAPNAAYRHFDSRQELLSAVRSAALSYVAQAMEEELAARPRKRSRADAARAGLRAVGAGYLRFAQSETGLFRTAFAASRTEWGEHAEAYGAGPGGLDPFQLLSRALDDMVTTGALDAARRVGAEYLAWSAVHGFALLLIEGPLQGMDDAQIGPLAERLLAMVEHGL